MLGLGIMPVWSKISVTILMFDESDFMVEQDGDFPPKQPSRLRCFSQLFGENFG
jgi:hypothetical protein